jgi:serine/threonine protein kinase
MSVHEDTFYLITEFCTSSLAQYLETVSVVPLDSFKHLVVAICRGMEYLHARAMLHGDLKPENILMDFTMSEGGTPKLCDFGFSRKSNRSSDLHEVRPGLPYYHVLFVDRSRELSAWETCMHCASLHFYFRTDETHTYVPVFT